ncbi:CPBP family glutamic-type intramembrane protease [Haloplanus halobius]|uniref:CPBP family glutamic-type intramembrane protease n=1 Tax=Haloplanus halobius TaxID=2934938 RepID=UPI00200E93A0|nr:CPBP family glutamic-type intramembrane protease [Haloplanus sp. XH21]
MIELVGFVFILAVGAIASARLVDRRSVAEYGFSLNRQWWRSFAAGGVIVTIVNTGAFVFALSVEWVTIVGFTETPGVVPFLPAMAVTFALIAVAAAWEEFVFRATMLKNLAEGADGFLPRRAAIGIAILLSTVVFAALHAGKVTHLSQYGYYLLAGLLLSGAYVLTGDLSLPIGFHLCYNFTMSAVFGLGVSQRTPEIFVLDVVGPVRWIGEEGLVHVLFAVVGGVLLLMYIYWRDGYLCFRERVTQW